MDSEDNKLLRDFVDSGSDRAFSALVARHADIVARIVQSRISDRDARRDVMQTVFCLMARKAKSLADHPSIAGWLVKTSVFETRKHHRREANRMKRETLHSQMAEQSAAPFTDEQFALVDDALAELPDKYRAPLLMRYYEGESFKKIAGRLGKSEGASQKLVSRAVQSLKGLVEKRSPGFGATTALTGLLTAALTPKAGAALNVGALASTALKSSADLSSVAILSNTIYTMTVTQLKIGAAVAIAATIPIGLQWNSNRELTDRVTELESRAPVGEKGTTGRIPTRTSARTIASSRTQLAQKLLKQDSLPTNLDGFLNPTTEEHHAEITRLVRQAFESEFGYSRRLKSICDLMTLMTPLNASTIRDAVAESREAGLAGGSEYGAFVARYGEVMGRGVVDEMRTDEYFEDQFLVYWALAKPHEAVEWVNELEPGRDRDAAIRHVMIGAGMGDHEYALQIYQSLDPRDQNLAMTPLLQAHNRTGGWRATAELASELLADDDAVLRKVGQEALRKTLKIFRRQGDTEEMTQWLRGLPREHLAHLEQSKLPKEFHSLPEGFEDR